MDPVINEDLKAYIDPLTADEYEALERSLLAEGCRDALVLWGDVLVDGHNRYAICRKHGLPFQTVQNTRFQSLEDVHLWMIDQHLGRRSVSDFQRGVLALRKRDIVAARKARHTSDTVTPEQPAASPPHPADASLDSREALARAARLARRSATISRLRKASTPRWKSDRLRRPRCWSIIHRCTSSIDWKRVFCTVWNARPCLRQMP